MDKSDLQAMLRFASQNNAMHKPFLLVLKWYNQFNSYNKYNMEYHLYQIHY